MRQDDDTNLTEPSPAGSRSRQSAKIDLPAPKNHVMQEAIATLQRIAPLDVNVMIVGEAGTGKEWIAQNIHRLSPRASEPFVPVDCTTLSPEALEKELFGYETIAWSGIDIHPGCFEEASGGTLLLKDVAALSQPAQMKVLRFVENRNVRRIGSEKDIPVNLRVIATLTDDPDQLLRKEILRKELYYSISPIMIELPPLRKRREDIPLLIDFFLEELRKRNGNSVPPFSVEAKERCFHYDWPGNIRLLRNAVEYATVMSGGETVRPEHLPPYLTAGPQKTK